MERTDRTEKNNKKWFKGAAFEGAMDPEFTGIARGFLCGDVLSRGCLTDRQRALVTLTALTTCQTLDNINNMRAAAPEELKHIQDYLSAYCFGDFYTRGTLDLKMRELITFCAICCLGGCEPQAKSHAGANISVGNTREMLIDAVTQCLPFIGFPRTLNAISCINEVTQ